MNTLGFTAEASIYKSPRSYRGSVQTYSGEQIVPAWTFFPFFVWLMGDQPCDRNLVKLAANTKCKLGYEAAWWELGYEVDADCEASDYTTDSNCNPSGGTCDCEITNIRPR